MVAAVAQREAGQEIGLGVDGKVLEDVLPVAVDCVLADADGEQLNDLGLELGCRLLSWFGMVHGWILLLPSPKI